MNYYAEAFLQEARMSIARGALTGLAENRVAFVSRDDVAAAAAGLLASDAPGRDVHVGAVYNATGPERLAGRSPRALREVLAGAFAGR